MTPAIAALCGLAGTAAIWGLAALGARRLAVAPEPIPNFVNGSIAGAYVAPQQPAATIAVWPWEAGGVPAYMLAIGAAIDALLSAVGAPLGMLAIVGVLVCAETDRKTGYIFDFAVLATALAAIVLGGLDHGIGGVGTALLGGDGALIVAVLINVVLSALQRGKTAIAGGDQKLLFAIGAITGLEYGLIAIGVTLLCAAVYAAIPQSSQGAPRMRLGPFLAMATIIACAVQVADHRGLLAF